MSESWWRHPSGVQSVLRKEIKIRDDRIEELEPKLAKANMKLVAWKAWVSGEPSNPPKTGVTPTNIADIKGQDND